LILFATTGFLASIAIAPAFAAEDLVGHEPTLLAKNTTDPLPESRAIVVLGDSISAGYGIQREQGWVELLSQSVSRCEGQCGAAEGKQWHVVNASISGETTGGGLARLPALLEEHEPGMVIIELGGNDGLRGYPIGKIRTNLTRIVELTKATGAVPVVMAMQIPPNYGPRYTGAFHKTFEEVADGNDVQYVPFLLENVALADDLMQDDGIHPTSEAQPLMLDAVWPYLEPLL